MLQGDSFVLTFEKCDRSPCCSAFCEASSFVTLIRKKYVKSLDLNHWMMNIDLSFQMSLQQLSFLHLTYRGITHSPTSKSLAEFQSPEFQSDRAHVVSMPGVCCS